MYREVVGSSGYFHVPETKCYAPGGNRAHEAAVHLRRSVLEPNVRALRVQDGRSRVGRTVFMVRTTPSFHGLQVRVSQRASTPRFMDVFRDILEGSLLRMDRPMFQMVPYIYHTLSSAVAQYLRHLDVPITTWLDDFWMSNFQATRTQSPAQQRESAREVASLALTVFTSAVISCRSPSACSSPRHGCCS